MDAPENLQSPLPPPEHPLDTALATIVQAMDSWKTQNDVDTLTKRVHGLLDKSAHEILLKLLGFDTKWNGKWEIDHCNGRNGESAAGDYIKNVQQEAIKQWLEQIKLPQLTPAFKKRIEKQLQDQYENHITSQVWRMAQDKANKDLDQLVNTVTASNTFEKYQKTRALLQP